MPRTRLRHRECIREMLSSIVSHRGSQTLRFDPRRRNERPVRLCNLSSIVGFRYFPGPSFFVSLRRASKLQGSRCFSAVIPPRSPSSSRSINLFLWRSPIYLRSRGLHRRLAVRKKKCNVQFQQYLHIYARRYRTWWCRVIISRVRIVR